MDTFYSKTSKSVESAGRSVEEELKTKCFYVSRFAFLAWALTLSIFFLLASPPKTHAQIRNSTQSTGGSQKLQLPTPIVTPRKNFDIPFHIDDPVGKLVEIQLYVSTDQGKTWNLYSRTSPQKKRFPFQSVGDGSYLFALKTLDRDRKLLPTGPPIPTLNIVVDTTKPSLQLQVDPGTGGRLMTSFRAEDPNLVADTLHLSYRLDGPNLPNTWVPIKIPNNQKRGRSTDSVLADRIGWWPDPNATAVVVKAEIKDQAGNLVTAYQPIGISTLSQIRSQQLPTTIGNHLKSPTSKNGHSDGPSGGGTRTKATLASSKRPARTNPNNNSGSKLSPVADNPQAIRWAPSMQIGAQKSFTETSSSSPGPNSGSSQSKPKSQADQQRQIVQHRDLFNPKPNPTPTAPKTFLKDDFPIPEKKPATNAKLNNTKLTNKAQTAKQYPNLGSMGSIDGQLTVSEGTSYGQYRQNDSNQSLAKNSNSHGFKRGSTSSDSIHRPAGYSKKPGENAPSAGSKSNPSGNSLNKKPTDHLGPNRPNTERQTGPPHHRGSKNPKGSGFQPFHFPEGMRPFLVNNRSFRLRYAVDGLSRADIAAVTVFGTADGGRTWAKIQSDQDRQSPAEILVNRPGIYGFKVVITSQAGVNSEIPKPGDRPDVFVQVDLTAPTPKIQSVKYGQPGESSHLVINWNTIATDLANRPISIAYSSQLSGPWTNVGTNLENDGHYKWMIGSNLPKKVYIRLSARDKAGNVGYHQLPNPINISPLIPKGRVLGIDR